MFPKIAYYISKQAPSLARPQPIGSSTGPACCQLKSTPILAYYSELIPSTSLQHHKKIPSLLYHKPRQLHEQTDKIML